MVAPVLAQVRLAGGNTAEQLSCTPAIGPTSDWVARFCFNAARTISLEPDRQFNRQSHSEFDVPYDFVSLCIAAQCN